MTHHTTYKFIFANIIIYHYLVIIIIFPKISFYIQAVSIIIIIIFLKLPISYKLFQLSLNI